MENTFRGKRIADRAWIYGDLINTKFGTYIIKLTFIPVETIQCDHFQQVDPETVGQFIDIQDIHKTDIYSGDKVRFLDAEKNEQTGIIKFKNCSFYIDCDLTKFYRWMDYSSFEIIGSIHENKQ